MCPPVAAKTSESLSCGFLSRGQKSRQDRRRLLPVALFASQKFPSRARQFVVLGPAIVIGLPPLRRNVSLLLELQQRGIQRPVVHRQQVSAGLLNAPRDPVTMQRPQRFQGLEDHQSQRALPHIHFLAHVYPYSSAVSFRGATCAPWSTYGLAILNLNFSYGKPIDIDEGRCRSFPSFTSCFSLAWHNRRGVSYFAHSHGRIASNLDECCEIEVPTRKIVCRQALADSCRCDSDRTAWHRWHYSRVPLAFLGP